MVANTWQIGYRKNWGNWDKYILLDIMMKGNPGEGIMREKKKFMYSKVLSDENSIVKNKSIEEEKYQLLLINKMLKLYIFLTTPFYLNFF